MYAATGAHVPPPRRAIALTSSGWRPVERPREPALSCLDAISRSHIRTAAASRVTVPPPPRRTSAARGGTNATEEHAVPISDPTNWQAASNISPLTARRGTLVRDE